MNEGLRIVMYIVGVLFLLFGIYGSVVGLYVMAHVPTNMLIQGVVFFVLGIVILWIARRDARKERLSEMRSGGL